MSSRSAHDIMRAYGCLAPTVAEQRAYVHVLDRMGAFAASERVILRDEGFLGDTGAHGSDGRVAHNPEQDDPAQAQGNGVGRLDRDQFLPSEWLLRLDAGEEPARSLWVLGQFSSQFFARHGYTVLQAQAQRHYVPPAS